ncbi:Mor transcription activator family protein [Methylomicrobium sp. Wu6]|uniref:Mor transcription activator family protein n=1 Tax=Methylomicrobium sp. Wu6 TaxID=3107928 RepID=UPI002DD6A706|nr:Mor transcription activator family protein [Methylomicrobium sp. Wu6]MEC4750017.1 Mor transcription activator family protein [Methylomicrobium sp. Wu6]
MIDLPLHLLPPKLREIAEYCDVETALLLLENAGGGHVAVPEAAHLHSLHQLVLWLGAERAHAFCINFSGDIIQIPRAAAAMRVVRNRKIREERQAGAQLFTLARRYGLTERQILSIVGKNEPNAGQFDLFGMD